LAAVKLQTFFRSAIKRMQFVKYMADRLKSCMMIQRCYREFRRCKMVPRAIKFFKDSAATKVQKYMKGFLVRK
jgi:hypothetical protein